MLSDRTALGDRMKRYEHTTRVFLPRRTYTLIRLDGRAFHTYLRNAEKPYDVGFITDMDSVALRLCKDVQGAQFAYVQSDEISILATDFESEQADPWLGGNLSKILSITSGMASSYLTLLRYFHGGTPHFDSRVWTMSDPVEVANYFVWRQRDAVRNSVRMVGYTYFSHGQLDRKSTDEVREMLFSQHQINWNDYPTGHKRGRLVMKVPEEGWVAVGAPHFKAEAGSELAELIPLLPTLKD